MASSGGTSPSPKGDLSTNPPSPDPRVGLKAGLWDAGQAQWNIRLVSNSRPTGNSSGKRTPISRSPAIRDPGQLQRLPGLGYLEPRGADAQELGRIAPPRRVTCRSTRTCSSSPAKAPSGPHRLRRRRVSRTPSARIAFAVSASSTSATSRTRRTITNVQTCRGSHTHTLLVDPQGPTMTSTSTCRGPRRFARPPRWRGVSARRPDQNPNSSLFRIEVIKVPLAHPEQAAIVGSAHIFRAWRLHRRTD